MRALSFEHQCQSLASATHAPGITRGRPRSRRPPATWKARRSWMAATPVAINARAVRYQARMVRSLAKQNPDVRFRFGWLNHLHNVPSEQRRSSRFRRPHRLPTGTCWARRSGTLPDRGSSDVAGERSSDPHCRRPTDQPHRVVVSGMMEVVAISAYPRQCRSDAW
jgi:hypothetical protein